MSNDSSSIPSITSQEDLQLMQVLLVLLQSKGIPINQDALFQLTDKAKQYFQQLSTHLQEYTAIQRRKKPILTDVQLLFRLNKLDTTRLYQEGRDSKYIKEKHRNELNRIGDIKNIDEEDSELLPFFNNEYDITQLVQSKVGRPDYIPSYLPDLPPDYTYQNTPNYITSITDMKTLRVNLVEQSRSTEKSLYNLIDDEERKWKVRFEQELEQLVESEGEEDAIENGEINQIEEDGGINGDKSDGMEEEESQENGETVNSVDDVDLVGDVKDKSETEETVTEKIETEKSIPDDQVKSEDADTVPKVELKANDQLQETVEKNSVIEDDKMDVDGEEEPVEAERLETIESKLIENDQVKDEKSKDEQEKVETSKDEQRQSAAGSEPKESDITAEPEKDNILNTTENVDKVNEIKPKDDTGSSQTNKEFLDENPKEEVVYEASKDQLVDSKVTSEPAEAGQMTEIDPQDDSHPRQPSVGPEKSFDIVAYAKLRRSINERKIKQLSVKRRKRQNNIFMQAEKYYSPYCSLVLTEEIDEKFHSIVEKSFKSCIKSIRVEEAYKQSRLQEIIDKKRELADEAEKERKKSEFVFGFNPNNDGYSSDEDDEFPEIAFEKKEETEATPINITLMNSEPIEEEESDLDIELENIMEEQLRQESEVPTTTPLDIQSDSDEDMQDI